MKRTGERNKFRVGEEVSLKQKQRKKWRSKSWLS